MAARIAEVGDLWSGMDQRRARCARRPTKLQRPADRGRLERSAGRVDAPADVAQGERASARRGAGQPASTATTCAWILPSTGAAAEAPRDRAASATSVASPSRDRVAGLDLVAQRRALAVRDRRDRARDAARLRAATVSISRRRAKPPLRQIARDRGARRDSRAACAPGSAADRRETAPRAPSSRRRRIRCPRSGPTR